MKHRFGFMLAFLVLLAGVPALADWDPAEEARYEAERKATEQAEQEKQREIQKMKDNAQAKYTEEVMKEKRKTLGAAQAREALSSGQGAAAVKQVLGKSMEELEKI